MDTTLLSILIVGSLLIALLGGYAFHLWRKVWQHRQALEAHNQKVSESLQGDLRILCNSLLTDQVPWVEGCIRIKVILEHYDFALSRTADYAVFTLVSDAIAHIPTHDAWKALDKSERKTHEATFSSLEQSHRQDSLSAARQLLELLGGTPAAAVQDWSPEQAPATQTLH